MTKHKHDKHTGHAKPAQAKEARSKQAGAGKQAAAKKHAGGTRATSALDQAGVDFQTHRYDVDPKAGAYATEAATALDVPEGSVFKTLVAIVDDHPVLALVPANRQLDLKALANSVGGSRAHMAEPHDAERLTGYVVGGISPLGTKRHLDTVADSSLVELDRVYLSAGKRGLQVSMRPEDLLEVTGARSAPIGRRI